MQVACRSHSGPALCTLIKTAPTPATPAYVSTAPGLSSFHSRDLEPPQHSWGSVLRAQLLPEATQKLSQIKMQAGLRRGED